MAWGSIASDASNPATYGDTTGFNAANSGGIDWAGALKTLGEGSGATDTQPVPIPRLQAPEPAIPQSAAVGAHAGVSLRDVIQMLYKQQQAYQQAGMRPGAGVVPHDYGAPQGLLGIR